jgi:hypothetical protein
MNEVANKQLLKVQQAVGLRSKEWYAKKGNHQQI